MPTAWRLPTLPTMRPTTYNAYQYRMAYITYRMGARSQ
jgi:hypothetical protein